MYKIYYTNPNDNLAYSIDFAELNATLQYIEGLRKQGMLFVTSVSDYANMVGQAGARGAGAEYVPQMLN